MVGQKSADQVRTGDTALGRGDLAAAEAAAAEAYRIAPWNDRAVALQRRIAEAKAQAQRDAEGQAAAARTAQVNAALNEASSALQNKQYEAAIAAYERALALDPGNAAAQTGRQAAIGSKSLADAAASGGTRAGGGPVKSFVPGRTEAKAAASGGLVGFEDTAGVDGQGGHAGRRRCPAPSCSTRPRRCRRPASRSRSSVFLSNEGSQPIPLTAHDRHDHRRRQAASGEPCRRPPPPWRRARGASCTRCRRDRCGKTARSRG